MILRVKRINNTNFIPYGKVNLVKRGEFYEAEKNGKAVGFIKLLPPDVITCTIKSVDNNYIFVEFNF